MSEEKFCKDCKWAKPYRILFINNWLLAKCLNPYAGSTIQRAKFLVSGEYRKNGPFCINQRELEHFPCGTKGRLWEAKNG